MNKDAGEEAQSELNKDFGDGSLFFFACDVTKYSDLESEWMIRIHCILLNLLLNVFPPYKLSHIRSVYKLGGFELFPTSYATISIKI